ncbi:Detected protein of unknown function [Hibiscus syriacus]|uniref:Uncharacterized protein n=1 Tax=Hibiscus syriacus TaxID=106335 RepID=A0A6A2WWX7_HIBSY|nr:Detected protein of unknown function [Hibiscus syriacus]
MASSRSLLKSFSKLTLILLALGPSTASWFFFSELVEELLKTHADNNSRIVDVKGHHYQLLPFGTGRRSCVGMSLAMQELSVDLAGMIHCFDWKVTETPSTGGVDMTERLRLVVPRAKDLKCFWVPRR